ncbi:MAG: pectate lyase [Hyphomonadaceae bacterium JAD_PAG50586_4]|nr:MAG: pectate lyase [Hyphomonadaceae bacterium JAD_PAG50586_4]
MHSSISRRTMLALSASALAIPSVACATTPAPPTPSWGWVRGPYGGAGGRIVRVTSLAAEGPGSLDAALREEGPRFIVFDVGGVIDLGGAILGVRQPFVTIAGETAPGPGITLIRGGVRIRTHSVLMRHLHVRPGDAERAPQSGWEVDGVVTESGAYDVIVDHCSITWATDENLSASGPRFEGASVEEWRENTSHRISFTNNIIAEGLSNATHSKGEHSKGSLIHDNVRDVLIAGNLYMNNRERNPLFKGGASGAVVNNLIYNPGRRFIHYNLHVTEWEGQPHQTGSLAIVGNEFRAGPSTPAESIGIALGGQGPIELHASDNLFTAALGATAPAPFGRFGDGTAQLREVAAQTPWPQGLQAHPAGAVAASVLRNAGARPWARDPIDARLIADVGAGRGDVIDSQNEVGGYPTYAEVRAPFDPASWDLGNGVPR